MDVLLVVDMQKALFETPRFNAPTVVANVNRVGAAIRRGGGRVVYIQHNGTHEEGLFAHSAGWSLLDALTLEAVDSVVEKSICDAFCATRLPELLRQLAPERLIVTGCATEFCVDTTIRSAVSRGFRVVAVSDAHTTADRRHLTAKAIVEHHNWVWKNLITADTPVCVEATADVVAAIERGRR